MNNKLKNQILRIFFGTLCLLFFTSNSLRSQTPVSYQFENERYEQIFKKIEEKTGYKFVYNTKEINPDEKVTITISSKEVPGILDELFKNTDITYKISNKHIALFKVIRKTVTGLVADPKGETIIGATILIKGTSKAVITNVDGQFSIPAANEDVLQISCIGYVTQNISVGEQNSFKVILTEDQTILDEVVIIGYGTVKKKDLTGAVSQVKGDQYSTQHSTNALDLLNGTVAGFNTSVGTSAAGTQKMEIRGPASLAANNSPLVVLDGVIFNGSINDINPMDIESIDILKDASSAAVFGSRSAAGVLIVNTKRGKEDKLAINFSVQAGVTDFTKDMRPNDLDGYLQRRQDFQERMNPAKQKGYYYNPNNLPDGISLETWQKYDTSYSSDPLETWMTRLSLRDIEQKNYRAGKTTDWYDEATQAGFSQNYNANISGGIGKSKYYWSLGYTDNEGHLKGDKYKAIRSRINADTQVASFLTAGVNVQFTTRDQSSETISLNDVISQSPLGEIYDENGNMVWYPHGDSGMTTNPFLKFEYRDRLNVINNLFANIYAELKLPMGFNYKVSFINRYDWVKNYSFDPSTMPSGSKTHGTGQRINSSLYEWQIDNIISWKKKFGVHDFYATFLYNAEKKQTWYDEMNNTEFYPNEALGYHQLKAGSTPVINNNDTYSTGTAIMGRLNYTLMDKYLLTLSIRRDGYSAFGASNPYATFPSGALAWVISEEPFFHVNWLNHLKLRSSYGVNGNRDIGVYESLSKLGTTKYISNGSYLTGIYSSTLANKGLKWEKTKALNLGFDFAAFKNRLSGTVEYYDMTTRDLLLPRSLPEIIGYSSVMSNMGELQNKGFEVTLNSRNIQQSNISWNTALTFSMNRNKIKHLYGEMKNVMDKDGNIIGQKEADDIDNKWFIGQALDRIWDYKFQGIYQLGEEAAAKLFGKNPGDIKLLDVDGNNASDTKDMVFQGYREPRFRLGLRNDITFQKNIQLSFFLRSDLGHYGANSLLVNTTQVEDRKNVYAMPYWTPTNPINNITRLNTVNSPAFVIYESRSFLRLQDISLAYNLPKKMLTNLHIGNCKLYVSSRNLLTFTKWSGWDPESLNTPMPRTFTFGIDVSL